MGFKPEDLILPGASILSDGINAVVDGINTRASRRWSEKMNAWQRGDALADYHMQNAYNSPASQMERLKAAGLNPNLVYGNGVQASNAGPVRSASAPSSPVTKTNINAQGAISQYLNAQQMKLQNDNLKAQNTVLLEQAKNIAADTAGKTFGANLKEFDFNYKTENRNRMLYKAEQSNINLWKQGNLTDAQTANMTARTNTEIKMRQPRVDQILQSTTESAARVLMMKIQAAKTEAETNYILGQIINAQKDGKLKDFEIMLNEYGATKGDPAWQRKAVKALNMLGL